MSGTLSIGNETLFTHSDSTGMAYGSGIPTGTVIQTVIDTYARTSAQGGVSVSNSNFDAWLGSGLEVSITFQSTSNKFILTCFVPDYYCQDNASGYNCGFKYSSDNFASTPTTFSESDIVSSSVGYTSSTDLQHNISIIVGGTVPVANSSIKIRPYFAKTKSTSNDQLMVNGGLATLIIQEIKQ